MSSSWKENAGKLYPRGMKLEPVTKAGKHGTLYQYAIKWDDRDPMRGEETSRVWAYSEDHAREKFLESLGDEGYPDARIKTVQQVRVPKGQGSRGVGGLTMAKRRKGLRGTPEEHARRADELLSQSRAQASLGRGCDGALTALVTAAQAEQESFWTGGRRGSRAGHRYAPQVQEALSRVREHCGCKHKKRKR